MWHSHHNQYLTHGWINTLRIKLVLALPWPPLYMPVLLFSPASWNQSVLEMKRLAGSEFENQVGKEYKNVQIHLLKCVFFYFPLFTVLSYFDCSVFLLTYCWSVSGSTTPSLLETSFSFSSLLFSLWFLWYFLYRCNKDPVNSSALISYYQQPYRWVPALLRRSNTTSNWGAQLNDQQQEWRNKTKTEVMAFVHQHAAMPLMAAQIASVYCRPSFYLSENDHWNFAVILKANLEMSIA